MWLQACGQEVRVVQDDVLHARLGQGPRQAWLPDALCKPSAARRHATALANVVRHLTDLRHLVDVGNRWQNRLVVPPAHHFHLTGFDQLAQTLEEVGMVRLKPFEQDARIVQAHPDARMKNEDRQKRQVRKLVGFFDHMIKVPHRLVGVNQHCERNFTHQSLIPRG